MRVQGPCPWWATLRPQASDAQPAPTSVSGWDSVLSLLSSKSSGEPAFLASSFVELALKFHLSADDRPLASFGHSYSDLFSAALIAVELKRKGFSGSFQSVLWKGAICNDRVVFGPLRPKPDFAVPNEWAQCLKAFSLETDPALRGLELQGGARHTDRLEPTV